MSELEGAPKPERTKTFKKVGEMAKALGFTYKGRGMLDAEYGKHISVPEGEGEELIAVQNLYFTPGVQRLSLGVAIPETNVMPLTDLNQLWPEFFQDKNNNDLKIEDLKTGGFNQLGDFIKHLEETGFFTKALQEALDKHHFGMDLVPAVLEAVKAELPKLSLVINQFPEDRSIYFLDPIPTKGRKSHQGIRLSWSELVIGGDKGQYYLTPEGKIDTNKYMNSYRNHEITGILDPADQSGRFNSRDREEAKDIIKAYVQKVAQILK